MAKDNTIIWIILGIGIIVLIGNQAGLFSVFPGEPSGNDIILKNQRGELNLFLEGDTINPVLGPGDQGAVDGIFGYMIFVNNKLFAISGGQTYSPHYSICGTESTSQEYWVGACGSWQHAFKDLLHCTSDTSCNYPGFNTLGQNKLEAGNNQEVEVRVTYHRNDEVRLSGGFYRAKINVAPVPCVYGDNQLLVLEDFRSGSTINKANLRFTNYFVKTCSVHPPIVVDEFTRTSYSDLNILTKLNNNFDYVVPQNKIVALFYVVDNNQNIPVLCEKNQAFDTEENICKDAIGFVTVCREGTFDPSSGICVSQPGIQYVCPQNSRYDTALNVCISEIDEVICSRGTYNNAIGKCIYNPDVNNVCPIGNYDSSINKCVYTPEVQNVCGTGIYNAALNKCIYNPDLSNVCIQGTYNPQTNACEVTPNLNYIFFI